MVSFIGSPAWPPRAGRLLQRPIEALQGALADGVDDVREVLVAAQLLAERAALLRGEARGVVAEDAQVLPGAEADALLLDEEAQHPVRLGVALGARVGNVVQCLRRDRRVPACRRHEIEGDAGVLDRL